MESARQANTTAYTDMLARRNASTDLCTKHNCTTAHHAWERCGLANCPRNNDHGGDICGPPCHSALDPACCHRWWGSSCADAKGKDSVSGERSLKVSKQVPIKISAPLGTVKEEAVFACKECSKDIERCRAHMEHLGIETIISPIAGFWT